jgi:hypothetical protein
MDFCILIAKHGANAPKDGCKDQEDKHDYNLNDASGQHLVTKDAKGAFEKIIGIHPAFVGKSIRPFGAGGCVIVTLS